jgi:hypothetical protein
MLMNKKQSNPPARQAVLEPLLGFLTKAFIRMAQWNSSNLSIYIHLQKEQ